MVYTMKGKVAVMMVLAVFAPLMVSGCTDFLRGAADKLSGSDCTELEERAASGPGMKCKCYPTGFIPETVKNKTEMEELEGKCYCTCSYEEKDEEVNKSIVEIPDGSLRIFSD